MNCDGAFTASDAWLMVKYAFFAPGDFVLMASAATTLGTPFDLSNLTLGGGASLVMSVVVWVIIFVLLGVFFEWLDACLKKVGEWTDTFGAWTDRWRGKEGTIKKKPSYDEWIKSEREKADRSAQINLSKVLSSRKPKARSDEFL